MMLRRAAPGADSANAASESSVENSEPTISKVSLGVVILSKMTWRLGDSNGVPSFSDKGSYGGRGRATNLMRLKMQRQGGNREQRDAFVAREFGRDDRGRRSGSKTAPQIAAAAAGVSPG